jgi:hypothetical protein
VSRTNAKDPGLPPEAEARQVATRGRRTLAAAAALAAVLATGVDGRGSAAATQANCLAPAGRWQHHVELTLRPRTPPGRSFAFGLPVPPRVVQSPAAIRVTIGTRAVDARASVLLRTFDRRGRPSGIQALRLELPGAAVQDGGRLVIAWTGGHAAAAGRTPFDAVSTPSAETAEIAMRTIKKVSGRAQLVVTGRSRTVLFTGREPNVLVQFPAGYLAATGILGCQTAAANIGPALAGARFVSTAASAFGGSAMYAEPYAVNPESVYTLDPAAATDPSIGYEGWLYDRCATYLALYANRADLRFLRTADRQCSYYARRIGLSGGRRGIFLGKDPPDTKYSHLRGLYAYYALTGDETALAAGKAIAGLWLADQDFVAPYRRGHLRGPDKLWTERLLATSIEGLYYGHLLTGDRRYLAATRDLIGTAYRHITGDAVTLAKLNPGSTRFPPQNCFVHNAVQADEGDSDEPFCSGWMPALMVAPLLAYQEQTGDTRADEIFIRLTRFLRDTGTSYFTGDILTDSFLKPSVPFRASDGESRRHLVPLYGAGVNVDGSRANYGEYDDEQHCLDASALVAAGMRALRRTGGWSKNPIRPFVNEGQSFLAVFEELAACAQMVFADQTRPNRDPRRYTSSQLAEGLGDPEAFIRDNKIGFPIHNVAPRRKLSWWFNPSLETFALLRDADVRITRLRQGWVASP